jgi:hypothetical protein
MYSRILVIRHPWNRTDAGLSDFQTWNYFPQLPKYQDFRSVGIPIIGILLYILPYLREFISQGFNINAKNLELFCFWTLFIFYLKKKSAILPKLHLFVIFR